MGPVTTMFPDDILIFSLRINVGIGSIRFGSTFTFRGGRCRELGRSCGGNRCTPSALFCSGFLGDGFLTDWGQWNAFGKQFALAIGPFDIFLYVRKLSNGAL
jgi:hypothetical protein